MTEDTVALNRVLGNAIMVFLRDEALTVVKVQGKKVPLPKAGVDKFLGVW